METANLRPYYDPDSFDAGYSVIFRPGIGLINTKTGEPLNASLASHTMANSSIGIRAFNTKNATDLDKNYVYDLEFSEYFDSNNFSQLFKNLVWNFIKNYCKVIALQPLEVTRLVLQVGSFNFDRPSSAPTKVNRLLDESGELSQLAEVSDSEEEVNYFQSSTELKAQTSRARSPAKSKRTARRKTKIQPISKHTVDIMTALVTKDGPAALFRGLNAQFLHQTLSHTIEAWITGFISPFLRIPDPFFLDLTHSTEPLRSLCLSVSACVITGVILMPLDLVKVRLMITQFNRPLSDDSTDLEPSTSNVEDGNGASTRSVRQSILNYPLSLLIRPPPGITFLTVLHQFATSVFRKSAPYILFIRYNIESNSSPVLYTLTNLMLSIMEFFIKLPVENLLRKEQVRFLLKPKSHSEDPESVVTIDNPDRDLIVDFNSGWNGPEESDSKVSTLWSRFKNLGLFNGWRVGVLNIVGFWGYEIMKSGTSLQEERL